MVLSESGRKVLIYSVFLLLIYYLLSLISLSISLIFGCLLIGVYGILNLVCMNQAFVDVAKDIFHITSVNDTWYTWFFWWIITLIVFVFVFFTMYVRVMQRTIERKRRVTSS